MASCVNEEAEKSAKNSNRLWHLRLDECVARCVGRLGRANAAVGTTMRVRLRALSRLRRRDAFDWSSAL